MPDDTAQLCCQPGAKFWADPQTLVLRLDEHRIEDQDRLPKDIAVEAPCPVGPSEASIAQKPRRGAIRSLGCTADRCPLAGRDHTNLDRFAAQVIAETS